MFIGHWSAAFVAAAASKRAPRLGTLFIAAQLVDWAFFTLVLFGAEKMRLEPGFMSLSPFDLHFMPYSHSLVGTAFFALAFALIVGMGMRDVMAGALTGAVVLSHWFLDLLVHSPDLTIDGSPPEYGLGLWDRPEIAIPLELALTFGAFYLYIRRTSGPAVPPLILAVLLLAGQLFSWFGPEPEGTPFAFAALALAAFALYTIVAWWVGTSRELRPRRG